MPRLQNMYVHANSERQYLQTTLHGTRPATDEDAGTWRKYTKLYGTQAIGSI